MERERGGREWDREGGEGEWDGGGGRVGGGRVREKRERGGGI